MRNNLQIASLQDGFRRCGVVHSRAATFHPAGKFTAEEVERLKAEPMLVVVEVPAGDDSEIQGESGGKPDGAEGDGARALAAPSAAADPEQERRVALRQAITDLGDDAKRFTASGKPMTEALEALVGSPVSAKERDQAWASIQADRAG